MVFSSGGISMRSIFSSSLMRLCTCFALVAWWRKRLMKASSCSMRSRWLRYAASSVLSALGFLRQDTCRSCRCRNRLCLFQISTVRLRRSHPGSSDRARSARTRKDNYRDTLPASCGLRDRDDWWARQAAAGLVSRSSSFASARRICQPPENSSVQRVQSSFRNPRPVSTVPTFASIA